MKSVTLHGSITILICNHVMHFESLSAPCAKKKKKGKNNFMTIERGKYNCLMLFMFGLVNLEKEVWTNDRFSLYYSVFFGSNPYI